MKGKIVQTAARIKRIEEYPFPKLGAYKKDAVHALKEKGLSLIDLSIGDLNKATEDRIVKAAIDALGDSANHHYPADYRGMPELRTLIAAWYLKRYGVKLNPDTEILVTPGAKDAITHLPLAVINDSEHVIVPNPCYPAYGPSVLLAGGHVTHLPLHAGNGFLPDLDHLEKNILWGHAPTKMMILNYPNNPTGAMANSEFFEDVVGLAKRKRFMVSQDFCYGDIFSDEAPVSFLATPGAKDIGIEIHSFSKTHCMTGWRVGMALGNSEMIAALAKTLNNMNSGIFQVVQKAAIAAIKRGEDDILIARGKINRIVDERRELALKMLSEMGIEISPAPKATFYLWIPIASKESSWELATKIIDATGVVLTPGSFFGKKGEGYLRLALTSNHIKEALQRIQKSGLLHG